MVAAQQRVEDDPALRMTLAGDHAVFLANEERAEEGVEREVEEVVVLRVKRKRGRDGIAGEKRAVEELQHLVDSRHPAVDSEWTDVSLHVVDQRVQRELLLGVHAVRVEGVHGAHGCEV